MNLIEQKVSGWKLPSSVTTRSGVTFDPTLSHWIYVDENTDVNISFDTLPPLTPEFEISLKLSLLYYVHERAPRTVKTMFSKAKYLLETLYGWNGIPLNQITEVDLLNFRDQGCKDHKNSGAVFLGQFSGLFRRWREMELPGLTEGAGLFLDTVTLPSNESGERVRTRCPYHGPFTDLEQQGVIAAMDNLFAGGRVPESVYWATWLVNALGLRPVQMAALKTRDLVLKKDEDGEDVFSLNVPRAKQLDTLAREAFTERQLIRELGVPLLAYARKIQSELAGRLEDLGDAPLFPATAGMINNKEGAFRFHATALQLQYLLKVTWKKVHVVSERTGELLKIHAYRFRYTFGTRMAQENCTLEQIASGLDHTNIDSAQVYVASTPEIAIRLDLKVASTIAPVAKAFLGKVIANESEAARGDNPASRIIDMRTDKRKPVGSCGTDAGCGLLKPLACYGCLSFEPWLDGPHQQLGERLIVERDQLLKVADPRIAAVNDRIILAVLHVAHICKQELHRREAEIG